MASSYRRAAWALVGFLAFALLAPALAAADEPPQQKRVAFAEDLRFFLDQNRSASEQAELQQAMRQSAIREWRAQEMDLVFVTDEELSQAITRASLYEGTLALARQWGEMGVKAYKQVQSQNAVDYLERALQNFATISHEMVAPKEMAEILMYLALSYLEDGTDVVRPLELLQEMIRRDPTLQLLPGYYPDFIVRYYASARDTLWRELSQDGPPLEESRRIGELVEADYVFHSYALPTRDGQIELVAYLYNVSEDTLFPAERLVLEQVDAEQVSEAMSRLTSRLAACLLEPVELPGSDLSSSQGTGRLSLHVALHYGSFLQVPSPLRSPFGNYGVGIGGAWSLTREFQLVGGVQIFNSMRDYHGLLREDFTTLRVSLGGQLGRRVGPVHLALATGAEMTHFGPLQAFTDPGCIPAPDILCPGGSGTVVYEDLGAHWGVYLRPRLAVPLADSFELSSAVSLGYYFSPLSNRLLNFPVTTELGINYRF